MDFIIVPLIVGICVAGVYGLFELFARRKERMAIIEKIGEKLDASAFDGKLNFGNYLSNFSFSALKVGCLMAGAGLGLLVGYGLNIGLMGYNDDNWFRNELSSVAFGAPVLLFGGIGLIIAFVIEMNLAKKEKKEKV